MDDVLIDISLLSQIRAIKENLYQYFYTFKNVEAAEFLASGDYIRWKTKVPYPWFNGVLSRAQPREDANQLIDETQEYFNDMANSGYTWWLAPDLEPEDWGLHLLQHGFRYTAETPGMAVELDHLQVPTKNPLGLEIIPVEDLQTLQTWVNVFIRGYGLPEEWSFDLFELMNGLGLANPFQNYLGFLDGQAIATSQIFYSAGVAGIYNVATLPKARGKGIGAAMTRAPLIQAREQGFKLGVLQSSEMGYPIYQNLGFVQLCTMDHFYWKRSHNNNNH